MQISNNISLKKYQSVQNNEQNYRGYSPVLSQPKADAFVKSTKVGPKNVSFGQSSMKLVEESMNRVLKAFNKTSKGDMVQDLDTIFDVAMTDVLTGLKNKRALFSDLSKHVEDLKAQGKTLTVAMFDMDNFKGVNDLLGYNIGDKFIRAIGGEVNSVFAPAGKTVYRFGGEEFIVLMPDTDMKTATELAQKAADKLSKNQEMKSHMWNYIFEGKTRIQKLTAEQAPLDNFKKAQCDYKQLSELFDSTASDASSSKDVKLFLYRQIAESHNKMTDSLSEMLETALNKATSEEDKMMIQSYIKKIGTTSVDKIVDKNLMNYLNMTFNNEAKIAQINKWIDNLQKVVDSKPQGFTITAGVKEFSDLDLPVEDIVGQTGKVLSQGKTKVKGQVYS